MSSTDQFRELIEAYALGALDPEERAAVEAHLAAGCAECAKALDEGCWIVTQLAYLAPEARPSEMLRGRLLKTVRADAATASHGVTRATLKPTIPFWMWGAVAAAMLFALYNSWNASKERKAVEATRHQVEQLILEQQKSQLELARARREALILTDPKSAKIAMAAANGNLPVLQAFWHQSLGIVVTGHKLPLPGANRTLQLWLIPKAASGKPIPSLTLRPDADGKFDLLVQSPPDSQDATKALAITGEPEGGSSQPTTAPIWVGALPGS